jgi:hypothetical protein
VRAFRLEGPLGPSIGAPAASIVDLFGMRKLVTSQERRGRLSLPRRGHGQKVTISPEGAVTASAVLESRATSSAPIAAEGFAASIGEAGLAALGGLGHRPPHERR